MEKHSWNKTIITNPKDQMPTPRWGHCMCAIGEELVCFGGFAESTYMNDLWSFNSTTMVWTKVATTGAVPSQRSNFSMSYDQGKNRLIIFGGGASNKSRYNTINILDWETKVWTEIKPKESEKAPWERTYHSAEYIAPYLVIFGGEGLNDLDDLWLFNFETERWIEVVMPEGAVKPQARRFHTSVVIGNEFFVIAGCFDKYRCLNDVFSLDLTPLLETGSTRGLTWKERRFTDATYLARWGHSSVVYDGKIYIFAGRFNNDQNDLLMLDLERNVMKQVKTSNNTACPQPRRRHSSAMVGASMIVFGGFNSEFFNDVHFINLFDSKAKLAVPESTIRQEYAAIVGCTDFADMEVISSDNQIIPIHSAILTREMSPIEFNDLMSELTKFTSVEILQTLKYLYSGESSLPAQISERFSFERPEQIYDEPSKGTQRVNLIKKTRKNKKTSHSLNDDQFSQFLEQQRQQKDLDVTIRLNGSYSICANSTLLSLASPLFRSLLEDAEDGVVELRVPTENFILFQILVNYLSLDEVVTWEGMGKVEWMELCSLAEYYCLPRLRVICEQRLTREVRSNSLEELTNFSLWARLDGLAEYCAESTLKEMMEGERKMPTSSDPSIAPRLEKLMNNVYDQLRFCIKQSRIYDQVARTHSKKNSFTSEFEKENSEVCLN